ncbi:acyl carrier protein [Aequorivita nionensis]|uniref:acyl carrier protein n=1 Tax=Aequorivita nionensis TaxID=1287690 RepID=UPI003965A0A2
MKTEIDIADHLKTMLFKVSKKIPRNLLYDDHFYHDLNIDSLDLAEYVANIEQEYQVRISDEDWEKLSSINAVVAYLHKQSNNL